MNSVLDQRQADAMTADALIAEARRRGRRRRLARSAVITSSLVALAAGVVAGLHGASRAGPGGTVPARRSGVAATSMPPEIVVVTGRARIEVVSSRTLRVMRTIATNAAMFAGPETLTASPSGVLFFDSARDYSERVMSVPLAGGPVRQVAYGRTPAISPDGTLLAYVAENKGSATLGPAPTGIVVRDLASGAQRTWALPPGSYIPAMTWSPDGRHLAVTTAAGPSPVTVVLDTQAPGRTLAAARRIPLPPGVSWAGYLTASIGVGIVEAGAYPAQRTSLVEVDVRTGQVIRRLTSLPQPLATGSSGEGPAGTIQPDPAGHYLLIAGSGRYVKVPAAQGSLAAFGEIFRWAIGLRHPVPILHRVTLAIWAGTGR